LAEQVDAGGADRLDFILLAFLLVQRPWRLVGDPGVGAVGQAMVSRMARAKSRAS
jgi:hypothetical protein